MYIAMEQTYLCNVQLCTYVYTYIHDRYVATHCWYVPLLFQFHSSYYLQYSIAVRVTTQFCAQTYTFLFV